MTPASETDQVFAAFVAAQSEIMHVAEDAQVAVGGGNRAGYASLPKVMETVRPVLNSHGLGLMQPAVPAQGGVRVKTKLVHISGQSIEDEGIFIPASKLDPQGHGSALSYARRYGLLSMLGIATHDDDGQGALQGIEREKQAEAQATARKAAAIDERELGILVAIAKAVSPATADERLRERYVDVPSDDFDKTLQAGLAVAVKQQILTADEADGIADGAVSGATVDEVLEAIANARAVAA
jgi:hypothetical protein